MSRARRFRDPRLPRDRRKSILNIRQITIRAQARPGTRESSGFSQPALGMITAVGRRGDKRPGRYFLAIGGRRVAMTATVLLVEDERKLRDLVRSYLERAGFAVLSTDSGAEAINVATTAKPDLIVLDLGLPDIPGDEIGRAHV